MKIKYLNWDSTLLGIPVYCVAENRLNLQDFKAQIPELKRIGRSLIYLILETPLTTPEYTSLSTQLIDEKLTYLIELDQQSPAIPTVNNIESITGTHPTPELYQLALQSGHYSRFNTDPRFPECKFTELYKEWLRRSLKGEIANEVLSIQLNNQEIGIITLSMGGETGKIGMLAVGENWRGNGYGMQLLGAASNWSKSQRLKYVEVITQKANTPACRMYERHGFKVKKTQYVYHVWI